MHFLARSNGQKRVQFAKIRVMKNLAKRAKALRDAVKKIINTLKESYFTRTPARLLDEIRLMAPTMHTLIELVIEFGKRYEH